MNVVYIMHIPGHTHSIISCFQKKYITQYYTKENNRMRYSLDGKKKKKLIVSFDIHVYQLVVIIISMIPQNNDGVYDFTGKENQ